MSLNPLHGTPFTIPDDDPQGCTLIGGVYRNFLFLHRGRLPQHAFDYASRWHKAIRQKQSPPPILFDLAGYVNQGIPMVVLKNLCISSQKSKMSGPDDVVLIGTRRINLRIMWPGYSNTNAWVRVVNVPSSGFTRAQLGQRVAEALSSFVDTMRTQPCTSSKYTIAGIRFDQVVLVGLYHLFDDNWQLDIAIDRL
ncbi:hypothetical protein CC1G_01058 [Coprinopsis cinerea okayama7|uniref:Uncharacterized protein n=1 Tax=Coprinopsis cinerea (strain Okayama-7 / 130 / ATCC MYA-4618 / FGSC 9003) TaxID=240176 RepID=A8NED4_COPC7|nr:hypothetical protein CC1G_01058 [Coprinopsis cinerea okayama7\|eukprot:XP_001832996.2 hypothetical protein CC1G_01058 [Coprinopsis cinerea okayama7\